MSALDRAGRLLLLFGRGGSPIREFRWSSSGIMSGALRRSAAQSLRFPAHTPGGAAFGGAVPHMRSLKLPRRGTPMSVTELEEKRWTIVLAVRSHDDGITVVRTDTRREG